MNKDYYNNYYEMVFREDLLKVLVENFALYIKQLYDNNEFQNYDYISLIKTSNIASNLDISLREEDYLVNNISKKLFNDYSLDLVSTSPMKLEKI